MYNCYTLKLYYNTTTRFSDLFSVEITETPNLGRRELGSGQGRDARAQGLPYGGLGS